LGCMQTEARPGPESPEGPRSNSPSCISLSFWAVVVPVSYCRNPSLQARRGNRRRLDTGPRDGSPRSREVRRHARDSSPFPQGRQDMLTLFLRPTGLANDPQRLVPASPNGVNYGGDVIDRCLNADSVAKVNVEREEGRVPDLIEVVSQGKRPDSLDLVGIPVGGYRFGFMLAAPRGSRRRSYARSPPKGFARRRMRWSTTKRLTDR
jgi:hypothetical protein